MPPYATPETGSSRNSFVGSTYRSRVASAFKDLLRRLSFLLAPLLHHLTLSRTEFLNLRFEHPRTLSERNQR